MHVATARPAPGDEGGPAADVTLRSGRHRRLRRLRRHDDVGSAAVEQVLSLTGLLLILGLIVAGGQYWHARHIAQSAASRALEAARADQATTADGERQGQASLDALGGRLLTDRRVQVTRTGTEVRVQITATAAGLIPLPVSVVRTGPVDRWVTGTR
ncbi:TadE/TadG family type IV pilus assembly protein [Actinoplanes sp. NPDC051475]|uniref:TadE/TadG family type IV pilus assembly protein n=1 Tax=Actinoplanes sp. NPDC051475 TaxID=3157225 RepID=UPI00345105E1